MGIVVTEEAADVLKRSLELARIDPDTGGVRLRGARSLAGGVDLQVEFAEGPGDDEEILDTAGIRIFVDSSVSDVYPEAVLAVEPQHGTIVLREP
jgi:Fe-S cluster assembly iron-binding protein IscA